MANHRLQEKIAQIVTPAIQDQVFPGCVIGVVTSQGEKMIFPFGTLTYEQSASQVHTSTVYDVASITKSIPTACLALSLIEQGAIQLDEKVRDYLPDFVGDQDHKVTIKHLLTQTVEYGFTLSENKHLASEDLIQLILTTPLKNPPGKTFVYTNTSSILLSMIIEQVTKKFLPELADEYFFMPLAMLNTTFYPERLLAENVAPTEYNPWRTRVVHREVHDESAYILREKMVVGSAGLFSTASDLLTFLQMILLGGVYREKRYFLEQTITLMFTNQLDRLGQYGGLGWELYQPRYMGKYASQRTIGKTGYTGCVVICDKERDIAIVMLANYHYPQRKSSFRQLNHIRSAIADCIFSYGDEF